MKIIEKRIENWCKDGCFVNFANRRMHQEITESTKWPWRGIMCKCFPNTFPRC